MSILLHKRGNVNSLPAEGLNGQLFITEDTSELYGGCGSSVPLLKFSPKRYLIGTNSYVLATGLGVTLNVVNNSMSFSVPKNVEIISASVYLSSTKIGANTNCFIDLGISHGCGHNASYETLYVPQFQVWADVENSRAFKTGVVGNLNTSANVLELTALTPYQSVWINLSF